MERIGRRGYDWRDPWARDDRDDDDIVNKLCVDREGRILYLDGRSLTQEQVADLLERLFQICRQYERLRQRRSDTHDLAMENADLKKAKAELEAKVAAAERRQEVLERPLEQLAQRLAAEKAELQRKLDAVPEKKEGDTTAALDLRAETIRARELADIVIFHRKLDAAPEKPRDTLLEENAELKRKLAEAETQTATADAAVGTVYLRAAELENQLSLAMREKAALQHKLDAAPEKKEVEATKALEAQIALLRATQREQEENLKQLVEQNDHLSEVLRVAQSKLDDAKVALRAADAVARESAKLKEQFAAAKTEIEELEATITVVQKSKCVVCLAPAPDTVVLPCLHLCLCSGCKLPVGTPCPLCRKPVISTTKVFMS